MPDHSNPTRNTLVFGGGSCGKTSFGIRYLINQPWTCEFVFSTSPQLADRLRVRRVGTAAECNAALASRIVCFNPYKMWDVNSEQTAFDWFCDFAYRASCGGPGRKLFLADDTWEFMAGRVFSLPLARIVKVGRFEHLEFMGITHRPTEYNIGLRSLVTEWIGFNSVPSDYKGIEEHWPGVEETLTLPKFQFISFDRYARTEFRGKLPPP